jgi:hypothetical protein
MPKIQPEDKTKETTFHLKLRLDIQAQILAYGSYLNPDDPSSKEYVVTELFREAIKTDKDFSTFWEKNKTNFLREIQQDADGAAKRGRPPVTKPAA